MIQTYIIVQMKLSTRDSGITYNFTELLLIYLISS